MGAGHWQLHCGASTLLLAVEVNLRLAFFLVGVSTMMHAPAPTNSRRAPL